MSELHLSDIDVDGAVGETAGRLSTRRGLLAAAGIASGLGAILRPTSAIARQSSSAAADDEAILNFALALEYLQAAFYTEAENVGALRGGLAEQAKVVGSHERAHVAAFRAQLRSAAIRRPRFDFRGVTDAADSFRATAVAFEDLAVGAYKEQLPKIRSRRYLATAVAIHSVEARHAAWIRQLAGVIPAAQAFDEPLPDARTVQIVDATRFVTLEDPRTSSADAPRFTG